MDSGVAELLLRDALLERLLLCGVLKCSALSVDVKALSNGRVALILLRHKLIKGLRLRLVLCGLTRQLLLHRLSLRLVVELRGFLRLTNLLRLSCKVGLLCGKLLLEVLPCGSVLQFLHVDALTKNLLQRLVGRLVCGELSFVVLRDGLVLQFLGLLTHAKLRHQRLSVELTCAECLLVCLLLRDVLRLLCRKGLVKILTNGLIGGLLCLLLGAKRR